MISRERLESLIPHSGTMCLLDEVIHWDDQSIRCRASSHRHSQNPLAVNGTLGAICGAEYAAQAMAVHGGLTGLVGGRPKNGFLMSLRGLSLFAARLDDLADDLVIDAERLAGESLHISYGFVLRCGGRVVVEGRAAVMLDGRTS